MTVTHEIQKTHKPHLFVLVTWCAGIKKPFSQNISTHDMKDETVMAGKKEKAEKYFINKRRQ